MIAAFAVLAISGCQSSKSASVQEASSEAPNDAPFAVTSEAFKDGDTIPDKYTESDFNFPLSWENEPKGTKSFAVLTVDLHPVAKKWIHWAIVNIPASAHQLPEGVTRTDNLPEGSKELINTGGKFGYGRPAPPHGSGNHEYKSIVYALDVESLEPPIYVTYDKFQELLEGHVLGSAEISGFYQR
jgi:hypothetical protein